MTSNNRCKLLVLDLNVKQITINDLRTFFTTYGPIEEIEIHPESTSAIISFVSYLIVDHLVVYRRCFIGQNNVRLRRFRSDENNWHIDSHTLYVKLTSSNNVLSESDLRICFQHFQSHIIKLDIIHDNQALISFSNYDYVDQILLQPLTMFTVHNNTLIFERMMDKIPNKSRWDQTSPIMPVRDPVVHKLINHIEHLTKQLRERSNHSENEIKRLEAEVFILKNENAQLKYKQQSTIEQRLMSLENISNRLMNKQDHQRERSYSHEKPAKRRRNYHIVDD